jgi:hypothetical protein
MAAITNRFARFEAPEPLTNVNDPRLSKTPFKLFCEFLQTKDFPKIFSYGIKWADKVVEVSPGTKLFGEFAGKWKNAISGAKIVPSMQETNAAVQKLWHKLQHRDECAEGDIFAAVRQVIRKASDCCNNVCDGIKLMGSFYPFGFMPYVDVFAAAWTFGGSVNNLVDDAMKVHAADHRDAKILHGFSIVMDLSYICVGALGLYAFLFSAPISIVLVPLTTALVARIGQVVFEGWRDPEHKNQDPSQTLEALKWSLQTAEA